MISGYGQIGTCLNQEKLLDGSSVNSHGNHDLLDQLVEEFTLRVRGGETPAIVDYQDRYPEWQDEIHELLSSVAMIEGLKQQTTGLSGATPTVQDELPRWERLGEYRIVRELGRGGMGIVLEAVHESLGRRVAIKVLPDRLVNNEKSVERFTREARAAAILHHNNIVSVFGVGHSDGCYYYVMEYIDGCGLDQVIRGIRARTQRHGDATQIAETVLATRNDGSHDDDFQLSTPRISQPNPHNGEMPRGLARFRWAADLMADIADALQYAHDKGVLHRDIKPGNLLLDPSGRIWLTDFGLVKDVTNQTLTLAGDIVGTPQYMAPESFESRYDVASETYCLGATLYELVTLRPLIEAGSAAEMIRRVTKATPLRPGKLDPRIPVDLTTIIEKATAKVPADRYSTAGQLRDDLRAFLQNRPISARPPSIPRRIRLWSQRNPWQALSVLLMGLVAVLASTGFIARSRSLNVTQSQNELLRIERDNTENARLLAEQNALKYKQQYARAEANIELSLEMFDAMFKQMVLRGTGRPQDFAFDGFQELSGIETTISKDDADYLENMLTFIAKFARENSDNTTLAAESAKAYRRVANIYHWLGRFDDAREAYQTAIRLYGRLNESDPQPANTLELAQTSNEFGMLTLSNGGYRQALKIFITVKQELESSPFASATALQMELVKTLNLLGSSAPIESADMLVRERDPEETASHDRRRRGFRNSASRSLRNMRRLGDENIKHIQQAIDLVNQLVTTQGPTAELLLERAKCQLRLAELQYWMDQPSASLQAHEMAVQDLSQITDQMPNSPEFDSVLAQAYAMPVGQSRADSLEQLSRAHDITSRLCETYPGNTEYLQLDAEVNYQLAQLYMETAENHLAIPCLQSATEDLKQVWQAAPRNQKILWRLNELTTELAELYVKQGLYQVARELLSENLRRMRRIHQRRANGRGTPARELLTRQCQLLIECGQQLGDTETREWSQAFLTELRANAVPERSPGGKREPGGKRDRRNPGR